MPSPRRVEKLEHLIREELARFLERAIEFPDDTLVTVTRVIVSPDAHYAFAMITTLPEHKQKSALEILKKNIYHIQQAINRALRTRPVPKITFRIDQDEERRERVEASLAQLKKTSQV